MGTSDDKRKARDDQSRTQPATTNEKADAPNRGRPHHGLDDSAETGPGRPVNPQRTDIPARHESSFQTGGSGETKAQHIKDRNVADEESEAQRKARADSAPGAPIHPDGKD